MPASSVSSVAAPLKVNWRSRSGSVDSSYGTFTGTTLMLLNGEPLISFVLITV